MGKYPSSLLGILALLTSGCTAFTAQRLGTDEIANSKNWTSPLIRVDRREGVGRMNLNEIENILRDSGQFHDSGTRELPKLPDEACSPSSAVPLRAKRSENITTAAETNKSTIRTSKTESTNSAEITSDVNFKVPEETSEKPARSNVETRPDKQHESEEKSPPTLRNETDVNKLKNGLEKGGEIKEPEVSSEKVPNIEKTKTSEPNVNDTKEAEMPLEKTAIGKEPKISQNTTGTTEKPEIPSGKIGDAKSQNTTGETEKPEIPSGKIGEAKSQNTTGETEKPEIPSGKIGDVKKAPIPVDKNQDGKSLKKTMEKKGHGEAVKVPIEKKDVVRDLELPQKKVSAETKKPKVNLAKAEIAVETSSEKTSDDKLKNVIFLLLDDLANKIKISLANTDAVKEFPIQGFLRNCRNSSPTEFPKFLADDSMDSGKPDLACDCDGLLRSNTVQLLVWARRTKEQITRVVSATNFEIPTSGAHHVRVPKNQFGRDFEDSDEIIDGMRSPEVGQLKSESKEKLQLIDLDKNKSSPSSFPFFGLKSKDGMTGQDGIWDIFDMFTKIRVAFFRILLESLGNIAGPEDESSNGKKSMPAQSTFVDLVTDSVKELKTTANGFVLVAAAPGNEFSAAIDALRREVSTKDTLLVISGTCTAGDDPIPFFAIGPNAERLREVQRVWELPAAIKDMLPDGCRDELICPKLRSDETPMALPTMENPSPAVQFPRKRVGRVAGEEKPPMCKFQPKKENENCDGIAGGKKRSGASKIHVVNVAKILGIVTSIAAMLNSP